MIVEHDKALPVKIIQQALEDGGFEVCDISSEDSVTHGSVESGYLDRVMDKWSNNRTAKPRLTIHLDNCDQCRREALGKNGVPSSSKTQKPTTEDQKNLISVVVDDKEKDVWQASLAVGGMTCAACVGTITEALGKKNWVKNVVVNLIGNSAMVDFVGEQHKDDLIESFDDIGYDATIDSIVNLRAEKDALPTISREVEIKVDGMFCDHCPPGIIAALTTFGDRITVDKPLTFQDPIMHITYTPQLPTFTIRSIIASISSVDAAFSPMIYHPPSLEERSRKIHARERKRILMRVIVNFVIAIPTFVIGIVFMSLVSSDNPARRYLQTPSAAHISRAQWALFALATPVWVLCADVFHIRAMKEVRALWRSGSTTPFMRRFYRFGSMNMLMSLGTSIAYISSGAQLIAAGAR